MSLVYLRCAQLGCGHACKTPCHPAPCPTAVQPCTETVRVRCACKRRKAAFPCNEVKVIPCDEQCQVARLEADKVW